MINCSRRKFILWSAAAMGGALLSNARLAAAQEKITVEAIRPGLLRLTVSDTNVIARGNDAGVLVVDGVAERYAPALLAVLHDELGAAATVAYNTHWHYEHNGSNALLRERGARIISHENTRLWLGADFWSDWQEHHYRPRPEQALPDETFYDQHALQFGDEEVQAAVMPNAHTDGDIYVQLVESNVLAVGGVMADGVFPVPDPATGGWIGGLVEAQKKLLGLVDTDTLIVPARGSLQRKADLQRQQAMLEEMCDRMYAMVKKGMSANDMLAAGIAKGFEEWGDPTLFVRNSYPGLWLHPAYSSRGIV